MADRMTEKQHDLERQQALDRLREEEKKDLEVEAHRGARPLEGFAGGHTTWTGDQDDEAAARVHAGDAEASWEASERQARLEPAEPQSEDEDDSGLRRE
ncbi:hypothetical protein [Corallococcus carmarthensis]|uniref:Uncharacterized protein n=1 Tax=Corallococcus carmarthensis TaxID=2316728 RepID=A0A3A8JRR1_9BACT|nr:hypothetical protein [Corallococcus carmarthensis]NOK18110.1 hypothetical protein [Corallococcus carmarthensis]RKG97636.1 hypothetical protein D7X32_32105 [Corallococcus carmarthensis]